MAEKDGKRSRVMVNRAPVLTLWASVVAEVLGFEHDEALTLGRAVAGLNAYSKGVSLGLGREGTLVLKQLVDSEPTALWFDEFHGSIQESTIGLAKIIIVYKLSRDHIPLLHGKR
jgi:hypothetical protein